MIINEAIEELKGLLSCFEKYKENEFKNAFISIKTVVDDHPQHIKKFFATIKPYDMRLNLKKCSVDVGGKKFYRFMVTQ